MMWRLAALTLVAVSVLALPRTSAVAGESGVVTATVTVAGDLTVELRIRDRKVKAGKSFEVEARVRGSPSGFVTVTLHHPGEVMVRGENVKVVRVRAGRTARVAWEACTEQPGQYLLLASAQRPGQLAVESNTRLVEVSPKKNARCHARDDDHDDDDGRNERGSREDRDDDDD